MIKSKKELIDQLQRREITLAEFKDRMMVYTDTLQYFVKLKTWT